MDEPTREEIELVRRVVGEILKPYMHAIMTAIILSGRNDLATAAETARQQAHQIIKDCGL